MNLWWNALSQLSPELVLLVSLFSILVSDLLLGKNSRSAWAQALLGSGGALTAALLLYPLAGQAAPLPPSLQSMFLITPFTVGLKALVLLLTTLAVAISHQAFEEAARHAAEFYLLILFAALGAVMCLGAQDLVLFFLAFELLSMPLYMLCAFRRYHSASAEAGLKYFLNGALCSALLLFGISWIYGSLGSTHLPTMALRYSQLAAVPSALMVGLLLVAVGLAFKVSAAPFHNWAPDVYGGAPASVSVFLSTAPKVAVVGFLARLYWAYLHDPFQSSYHLFQDWFGMFALLSGISMFVGNLSALTQTDVRKIFAFSGVAQIGYLFLGLAAFFGDNPHPERARAAVFFYLAAYGVANLGAWGVLAWVERENRRLDLKCLRGLHQRSPMLAACLAVCLMSLAGVPPLSGFVGKFYLFRSIYESHYPFLVVFGILNSVISLFYYFKVLKAAYFVEPEEGQAALPAVSAVAWLAFQFCLWSNVVFGLWPGLMAEVVRMAAIL